MLSGGDLALLQSLGCGLACAALQMCQIRVGREILKNAKWGNSDYFPCLIDLTLVQHYLEKPVSLTTLRRNEVCRLTFRILTGLPGRSELARSGQRVRFFQSDTLH